MAPDRQQLGQILAALPKRSLRSTIFNSAHAYARVSDTVWSALRTSKDGDFAAPAIMCQSFAIELLLKFFLTVDHPAAKTTSELKAAGVRLRCHKYSELFDQLTQTSKDKIASAYTDLSGKQVNAVGFRQALIAQGDDPFVYWRYIYETNNFSYFDIKAFNLVTDALGKAAEAEQR